MRRYGMVAAALLLIPALAVAGGALGQQNNPGERKITLLSEGEVVGILTVPTNSPDKFSFNVKGGEFVMRTTKLGAPNQLSINGDVSIRIQRGDKTVLNVTAEQAIMEIPEKAPKPQMETNH